MALFSRKNRTTEDPQPVKTETVQQTLPGSPANDKHGRRKVKDHQQFLLSLIKPLEPFGVQLLEAWGHTICEDLKSMTNLPAQDSAKYGGFAVSSADLSRASITRPAELDLVSGPVEILPVSSGVKIQEGRPIPVGADVVVPADQAKIVSDKLQIETCYKSGDGVLRQGQDISVGDPIISFDEKIDARHIGLLASLGIDKVLARPKPRVVVMSVGEGLIAPGRERDYLRETYDMNSYMLAAAARASGAQVWRVECNSLDEDNIKQTISDQLIRADLILTTGGIEPGTGQTLRHVVPELGVCDFSILATSPVQTHGVGIIGDEQVPIVMLPSDPVAAYTAFAVFVIPMLRKFSGAEPEIPEMVRCFTTTVMRSPAGKTHFVRGVYQDWGGRRMVSPAGSQTEMLMSDLASANCIIELGPDVTTVDAGQPVMVIPLSRD